MFYYFLEISTGRPISARIRNQSAQVRSPPSALQPNIRSPDKIIEEGNNEGSSLTHGMTAIYPF